MDTVVLVDGFYSAYRSFYAFKDIRTKDGRPSGLLFGFVRTLLTLKKRWPKADIIVCWDSPSTWRKKIYNGYKGNRSVSSDGSPKPSMDRKQIYACADFIRAVGLRQALSTGHEADDVIGSIIDRSKHNIIFSRDRDFCQLVQDGVVEVYSPKSGDVPEVVYNEATVKEKFGVPPHKLLHYRMFKGDSSDNLPGLPRFPSKKILELLDRHDNIQDIFDSPRVPLTEHQKKALTDFRHQAGINLQLMRILTDIEVKVIEGVFNRYKAETVLDEYELKSLKTSINTFLDDGEEELLGFFAI